MPICHESSNPIGALAEGTTRHPIIAEDMLVGQIGCL